MTPACIDRFIDATLDALALDPADPRRRAILAAGLCTTGFALYCLRPGHLPEGTDYDEPEPDDYEDDPDDDELDEIRGRAPRQETRSGRYRKAA
jgi:hypothetical protein